ncbi:MAG: tetratricopeptide repeat protein [Helicobacter sp.]|uniref:tetratricopeptide repeat protein n=1 Tax=Helicobacter sp. TaxID=218 RepID=UPI0023D19C87|nr:tetratricopeptide repeat protein [Helicobacter sp.]MDE5925422.1 tetratricopeptide repeat protein [Helicobacter sp.]MDE7174803.1 tetratricopeptide repeat protein [Helicobacter sp.]
MLQKLIASSLFLASLLFGQEPSAFNAGGSTPPKSESQIINEKLFNLSNRVQAIEESQEGLKSIFEGQIQRIQNLTSKIDLVQGESNATSTDIKKHVDSNFALQNENIDKLKNSISALGALIQKTNTQMQNEINTLKEQIIALEKKNSVKESQANHSATKEALKETEDSKEIVATNAKINAVIANLESNSTQVKPLETENIQKNNVAKTQGSEISAKEQKPKSEQVQKDAKETKPQENKESKTDLKNKKLSDVFKEGEEFVKNKNYESAEEYLQFAVKSNYKPARGNYLLGEVAFAQKRYEDAIYYYKTSATRYDKADYMPRLMLNSAKSFNAIKEKENAKRFLETLISLYPNSSEAKEAKKLLK